MSTAVRGGACGFHPIAPLGGPSEFSALDFFIFFLSSFSVLWFVVTVGMYALFYFVHVRFPPLLIIIYLFSLSGPHYA